MERLIKAEGDVDALVALHAQDFRPTGATHLLIAEELESAGRAEEALVWAERGLRACAAETYIDGRLVDYVCARYAQAGRAADAVAVRRDRFRLERSLAAYRQLRSVAGAADCWEAERAAALAILEEDARRERGGRRARADRRVARRLRPGRRLAGGRRPRRRPAVGAARRSVARGAPGRGARRGGREGKAKAGAAYHSSGTVREGLHVA
jgi:hypothetical protein